MNFPPNLETSTDKIAALSHLIVVMTVVIAATVLRFENELDTPTLGTVFGAAMGYATGVASKPRTKE